MCCVVVKGGEDEVAFPERLLAGVNIAHDLVFRPENQEKKKNKKGEKKKKEKSGVNCGVLDSRRGLIGSKAYRESTRCPIVNGNL